MHIAVTGSSGRLGRVLLPQLIAHGHTVHSLDRVAPEGPTQGVTHTTLDMSEFAALVEAVHGCDAIIHLAAWVSPHQAPEPRVYVDNTAGSYHVLAAAASLDIKRVCLASSVNAIGGIYSRAPRYDYFPVDEQHPTYAEDPYSLSKWVLEQQGDAFARRHADVRVASLRFHGLMSPPPNMEFTNLAESPDAPKHLWGYTHIGAAARACELAITTDLTGHQVFYIVAPTTLASTPSLALAQQYYPHVPIRGDLSGRNGFFDCSKAERLLGWRHED